MVSVFPTEKANEKTSHHEAQFRQQMQKIPNTFNTGSCMCHFYLVSTGLSEIQTTARRSMLSFFSAETSLCHEYLAIGNIKTIDSHAELAKNAHLAVSQF